MDILGKVKVIQKDQGLNDTQVSELLGYRNREGWAKIKTGIVPANKSFQMRAIKAFPELRATLDESPQNGDREGWKGIYDKIVLRVKKFV